MGFSRGSAAKESTCNVGDLGSIPGLGRSPGEWKGYPLQYTGLENSMGCIVHGDARSQTQLSDFHSYSFAHSEKLTEMKNLATAPLIARSKICIFQYICLIKKY